MERADVAIVGGGPAGSAAAAEAAADRDELGPDSTDAAGMLDYWVDIMGFSLDEIPDEVILQELSDAEFVGPTERMVLRSTGIDATYPKMGFTFDRVGMDDWMRERAEDAGADYRVGTGVRDVETDLDGDPTHTVVLADGEAVEADALVLADGPQRTVTNGVLDRFLPEGKEVTDYLASTEANHIAYQEHRRFPEELFDDDTLKFWWGLMPGETAYPWVFPNDDGVARVGLTMPIGMDIDAIPNREEYDLLRPEDESIPRGGEYLRRLLEREYGDEYDIESDFPLVEDRGKRGGTETYPISSTKPVDSPVGANVALAGGAMGTTSAFHEGGYHVAVRTGREAGRLAAEGDLSGYNRAWKRAIGDEIRRNVAFADIVGDYTPADFDRAFRTARKLVPQEGDEGEQITYHVRAGISGLRLYLQYKWTKFGYRDGRYGQIPESTYVYG
ncbi:NAD(P)/FAD-dependent oxidoreductase [Halobacteriales archaeon QS_8_69_26]|nr:MAG: NAD(P)/FAD-dependent oxidoreductase [Halobacteriales archaeon QS_8_69_26]